MGVDWEEGLGIRGGVDLMPNHDDILGEAFFFSLANPEKCVLEKS